MQDTDRVDQGNALLACKPMRATYLYYLRVSWLFLSSYTPIRQQYSSPAMSQSSTKPTSLNGGMPRSYATLKRSSTTTVCHEAIEAARVRVVYGEIAGLTQLSPTPERRQTRQIKVEASRSNSSELLHVLSIA